MYIVHLILRILPKQILSELVKPFSFGHIDEKDFTLSRVSSFAESDGLALDAGDVSVSVSIQLVLKGTLTKTRRPERKALWPFQLLWGGG